MRQGASTLTLERKGQVWGIKERSGYPADAEKVRGLLVRLAQAELLEPKTSKSEKYALLDLEDPAGKDAKSRSVALRDSSGSSLGEVVLGKRRPDMLGSGRGATYVRKPSDPQTWLASGEIDVVTGVKDWVKPQVLDTDSGKIDSLTLEIPGEEPLKVERGKDKDAKVAFVGFPPEGKKLKDTWSADSIMRSAGSLDLDDVRTATAPAKDASKVTFQAAGGLKVTHTIRKDGDAFWVTIAASGEGDAKKQADEINTRTLGWEYKISNTKAETLLKKRADLLDDKAS